MATSTPTALAKKLPRLLLTLALLAFALQYGQELIGVAYDIRMHALRTYGYIIHEVSRVRF
jgi:hypothetical protein